MNKKRLAAALFPTFFAVIAPTACGKASTTEVAEAAAPQSEYEGGWCTCHEDDKKWILDRNRCKDDFKPKCENDGDQNCICVQKR